MSSPSRAADWFDTVWYQTVSLGTVTLLAGAALALAHMNTGPAIAEAEARDVAASLAQVLPANSTDNDLLRDTTQIEGPDGRPLTIHRARREGEITAVVFQMTGKGYAGPIHLVMGVDRNGQLTGVRVTRHSETPGLGDKIEISRDPWVDSFAGRSLDNPPPAQWGVKKDGGVFDQFAGATVTPRAVVNAVKAGLEVYAARRHLMFADDEPAAGTSPLPAAPEVSPVSPTSAPDGAAQ
ncbi:MAG: RnfABCDGE type electron transport complex subunit G [Rhodocyclaceae bacterium]